ncbi:MAG: lipopolysaccharide heptosyltransferase II [Candidatus Omnitrophota bacterium]|nr:MAG: lipopolysaccharide heptosyltransferase II [Candidatus Omnitrophota bacterium]
MIDKSKVHNILFLTLSNIGDVILTLPVLGVLKKEFPNAKISVMVSPQAKEIFSNDPAISKIISYDKHISFLKKIKLGLRLRRRNFDLVVDLRSTLYPVLINAPYRTSLFTPAPKDLAGGVSKTKKHKHKRYIHLNKLLPLGLDAQNATYNLLFSEEDKRTIKSIFEEFDISEDDKIVAVAPGAKSHIKRWTTSGFIKVCQRLNRELGIKVLLVGDTNDKEITSQILSALALSDTYDISGRTNIHQLGCLLSRCKLLITNDSAPLHLADIVNTPSVAIFGPTDHIKYGPTLENSVVIRKNLKCSPCEKAQCAFNLECMKQIGADEVFAAAKKILEL